MVIVIHDQNLMDIGIQEHGNAQASFDIALNNNLNLTQALTIGGKLKIDNSDYTDIDIQNYYRKKEIKPATGNIISQSITADTTSITADTTSITADNHSTI